MHLTYKRVYLHARATGACGSVTAALPFYNHITSVAKGLTISKNVIKKCLEFDFIFVCKVLGGEIPRGDTR